MKRDQGRNIHVSDTIAVGETEGFISEMLAHAPQTATGECTLACVYQCDTPGLSLLAMHLVAVAAHVKRDIAGVEEVVGKIFLDQIALIAAASYKIVDTEIAIDLENMPENRLRPTSIIGFGRVLVSSEISVPRPPARMTAFMVILCACLRSWETLKLLRA